MADILLPHGAHHYRRDHDTGDVGPENKPVAVPEVWLAGITGGAASTVTIAGQCGPLTDASHTFTSGAAVTVLAADGTFSRKYLVIQPLTNTCYVCFTGTATAGAGSFVLYKGGTYIFECVYIASSAVSILPTQSGDEVTVNYA